MYNLAICHSQEQHRQNLEQLLHGTFPGTFLISPYSRSRSLHHDIQNDIRQFDLILLDVPADSPAGIEEAKRIRSLDWNAVLLLLATRHEPLMASGAAAQPFHHLQMPIHYKAFTDSISHAIQQAARNRSDRYILICNASTISKVCLNDVTYIEVTNRTVAVHMAAGNTIRYCGHLKDVSRLDGFFMPHKAFLVNIRHVAELQTANGLVEMLNGEALPLSRGRVDDVIAFAEIHSTSVLRYIRPVVTAQPLPQQLQSAGA